jgi:hypothetical protein
MWYGDKSTNMVIQIPKIAALKNFRHPANSKSSQVSVPNDPNRDHPTVLIHPVLFCIGTGITAITITCMYSGILLDAISILNPKHVYTLLF